MTFVEGIEFIKASGSLGVLVILVYWMMSAMKEISENAKKQIELVITSHNQQSSDMNNRHERQMISVHEFYEKKLIIIAESYEKSINQIIALLRDSQNSSQEISKQSVSAISKQKS